MSIKNTHFILVRPQMGENVGSVARAIKNFNITKLRIVNPICNWPNQKALATSVGAKDILKASSSIGLLSFHSPSYVTPSRKVIVPMPCLSPFLDSPSYITPSG